MKQLVYRFFQPLPQPVFASSALLALRLIVGIAFLYHGWGKIKTPFSWMPPDASVPGILQFLAAFSEFGGGIALILGLLTSLAMLGLGFTMIVATAMHKFVLKDPFVASAPDQGSYELALVYVGIALLFLAIGPGRFSLDALLFRRKEQRLPVN